MTDTTIEESSSAKLPSDQTAGTTNSLDTALIKNIPVTISVEVGRSVLKIAICCDSPKGALSNWIESQENLSTCSFMTRSSHKVR